MTKPTGSCPITIHLVCINSICTKEAHTSVDVRVDGKLCENNDYLPLHISAGPAQPDVHCTYYVPR